MPKRKDHRQLHGPQHGRRGENGAAVYYLHARPPRAFACSFVLGRFLSAISNSIYYPALPVISQEFHETLEMVNLSFGGVPFSARALRPRSRRTCRFFGRRPTIVACFLVYIGAWCRPLAGAGVPRRSFCSGASEWRHSAGDRHQRRHFGRRVHARRQRGGLRASSPEPFGRTSVRVALGSGHPQPLVVARHLRLSRHRPGRHARASSLSAHRNVRAIVGNGSVWPGLVHRAPVLYLPPSAAMNHAHIQRRRTARSSSRRRF